LLTLREMVIGCRCHHLGADPSSGPDATGGSEIMVSIPRESLRILVLVAESAACL